MTAVDVRLPDNRPRGMGTAVQAAIFGALAVIPLSGLLAANGKLWTGFTLVSVATSLLGPLVFYQHGGGRITATGVFFLGIGVFAGLGGFLIAIYGSYPVDRALFYAAVLTYATSLLTYQVFLRNPAGRPRERAAAAGRGRLRVPGEGLWIGPVLVLVGLYLSVLGLPLGPLPPELAHCGVLLTAGALLLPARANPILRRPGYSLLAGVAIVGYVVRFFSGYGRLNLATMALSLTVLFAVSHRARRPRLIKLTVIVAVIPFLILGAAVGASRSTFISVTGDRSTYALEFEGDLFATGRGLESVMSPLARFADLIRLEDSGGSASQVIGQARGSTFLVALVPWIPRSWWPDKPFGFGRELATLLTPYGEYGHSEAALNLGEWFYNFAWLGLAMMVALHGPIIRRLDRYLAESTQPEPRSMPDVVRALVPIVLTAGLADYVWIGTFTYMSRAGTRAFILIILGLLVLQRRSSGASPNLVEPVKRVR